MTKPLAIDLCCGLGGWTEGLQAEGYDVVGFDIEQHVYGELRYPAQLVVQDILTLHGSQFRTAALIVASPPCQEYSYMAMPWSRAKAKRAEYLSGIRDVKQLTALFDASFRIQREACEAAGRHIPMVVENVRGAQEWVGPARGKFGSFYFWGDVPAVMPVAQKLAKVPALAGGRRTDTGKGARFTSRDCGIEGAGLKMPGINLSEVGFNVAMARTIGDVPPIKQTADMKRQHIGTKRKMASAMIAKIPFDLSRHIAAAWHPRNERKVA